MLQNFRQCLVLALEKTSHVHLRNTILVFGFLLLLVLWLIVYSKIEVEKELVLGEHHRMAENYARGFEEHILTTIQVADQTLLFLKYLYEKEGNAIDIPKFVQAGTLIENPAFILMGFIDNNGEFTKSNQVPFVPSSLKDREHFTVHLHKNDGKLFISKPVLGRSSGRLSLQLTRRINAADGTFNGVAVLTLDPNYFTNFYKTLYLGSQSAFTIVGYDSIVRARYPENPSIIGQDISTWSKHSDFTSFVAGNYSQSTARFVSPIDGVERLVLIRKVSGYPLVVVVGLSVDEILATHFFYKKIYLSAAGMGTVIILLFILLIFNMIESQRRRERDLRKERESLEEKVVQRTKDLTIAFEQSKHHDKMASIGCLAAGIAHEINNPLSFISNNMQSLQNYSNFFRDSIDVATGQIYSSVDRSELQYVMQDLPGLLYDTTSGLNRMTEILKALRMFSRSDQTSNFEPYDLNAGIRDAVLLTRNEHKSLATVEENLSPLPQVPGIALQISQVIINLLLNACYAIKKTDRADGKIMIRSYRDGNSICCEIQDNGCGIPQHISHSIFEPFFTTKPAGVGTGLGLSISYDIIANKHGGTLSFKSVEGEGSIFMLCLPVRHD